VVSVPARRLQVVYAAGKGLSQRRACTLLGVSRSALTYQSVRTANDAPVLARMAELSAQYPRYGYRRIAIFLARDGYPRWRQGDRQRPACARPKLCRWSR
jgi:putative transposase